MKRYWLFACAHYYPNGGLSDLIGTFDTWEECLLCIENEYGEGNEWCQDKDYYDFSIFDSEKHVRYEIEDEEILARYIYRGSLGFVDVSEKNEKSE
jgi:hypothetical protein